MPNAVTNPAVRQRKISLLPIISKVYNVMSPELGHYFLVPSISVALTNKLRPVVVPPYSFPSTMSFSGILFRYIPPDFSNYNVFTNSNANAPSSHKISGTWSNHEGSLLLWCWIPSFYGFLLCYPARPSNVSEQAKGAERRNIYFLFSSEGLDQRAVSLMDEQQIYEGIALFFSIFPLASSNPFVRISFVRTKSLAESNPVSQDPVPAIHPPCIYAGYVASAIGFCLCLSGMINRPPRLKNIFLFLGPFPVKPRKGRRPEMAGRFPRTGTAPRVPFGSLAHRERAKSVVRKTNTMYFHFGRTRHSANTVVWEQIQIRILTCRCFLTVGISLGSWWAYHESGRGGWWFWDPVENASFMPWVLATACIHSVISPRLNDWTLFLNMVTFLCCISGTFSVRSGLLAPVHSFATDSTRGIFLWCFFSIITSISFIYFFRMKQRSSTQLALSVPSSTQDPTVSKPVNQILWHSRSTLFAHSYRSDRLAKLMEGTAEGRDRVIVYRAGRKPK
uniref:Cytochrome c biogenesis factor N n=1 Tax=Aneura pinguis TaxID=39026 RepID=A0A109WVP0_ANEPI|nr:cytochrome c biogenesis factor N [Aneura pinguis]WHW95442.1 heme lyase [Aneura pinguis]WHW95484.1 heme lyase [Aneura pinguis]WHW95526.1 heme lyase [Aneura pinguis]WHW95568.1 heme lyase [Aneura pinguis]